MKGKTYLGGVSPSSKSGWNPVMWYMIKGRKTFSGDREGAAGEQEGHQDCGLLPVSPAGRTDEGGTK